jgi:hypothetical protein
LEGIQRCGFADVCVAELAGLLSQKKVGAAFCTFRLPGDSRCAANAVESGNPFCQKWT